MKKPFKKFINKDQVKTFPLQHFDGEILFFHSLSKEEQLTLIQEMEQQKTLGLDTETKPSFTKGVQNPLALLQIYLPHRVVLFQLRKYSLPPHIQTILENPQIIKIGVAIAENCGFRK